MRDRARGVVAIVDGRDGPMSTAKPPRFEDLPEMVTVEEMGAFLRLSRNAAYELVKSGAIRSAKFGRLIRIPKQALLEGR
jgi:excisionase family DNA binding protein